jgi:hypothetical protein
MLAAASASTILSASDHFDGLTLESLFYQNQKQLDAWNVQCENRFLLYGGAAGRKSAQPRSPRPEPWLPYVFASPMDAVAAGFAGLLIK